MATFALGDLNARFRELMLMGGGTLPLGMHLTAAEGAGHAIEGTSVLELQERREAVDAIHLGMQQVDQALATFYETLSVDPTSYSFLKKAAISSNKSVGVALKKSQEIASRTGIGGNEVRKMHLTSASLEDWARIYNTSRSERKNPGPLMRRVFDKLGECYRADIVLIGELQKGEGTEGAHLQLRGAIVRLSAIHAAMQKLEPHMTIIPDWEAACAPVMEELAKSRGECMEVSEAFSRKTSEYQFHQAQDDLKGNMQRELVVIAMLRETLEARLNEGQALGSLDLGVMTSKLEHARAEVREAEGKLREFSEQMIATPDGDEVPHPEVAGFLESCEDATREFDAECVRIRDVTNEGILGVMHESMKELFENFQIFVNVFVDKIVRERDGDLIFTGSPQDIINAKRRAPEFMRDIQAICNFEIQLLEKDQIVHPDAAIIVELAEEINTALGIAVGAAGRCDRMQQYKEALASIEAVVEANVESLRGTVKAFLVVERSQLLIQGGEGRYIDGAAYPAVYAAFDKSSAAVQGLYDLVIEAASMTIIGSEGEAVEFPGKEKAVGMAEASLHEIVSRRAHYEDPEILAAELKTRYAQCLVNIGIDARNPMGVDVELPRAIRIIEDAKFLLLSSLHGQAQEVLRVAAEADGAVLLTAAAPSVELAALSGDPLTTTGGGEWEVVGDRS